MDAESRVAVRLAEGAPDLRGHDWRRLVAHSGAKIISSIASEQCDAYLLSESSLFVWRRRFILITCGQTSLLDSLRAFLDEADGPICALDYVRRNDDRPPDLSGIPLARAGALQHSLNARGGMDHHLRFAASAAMPVKTAQFYGLSPAARARFCGEDQQPAVLAWLQQAGLVEGWALDTHCFQPVGYSANAIAGDGLGYWTLHVTPEAPRSYASFESSLPGAPIQDMARWLGAQAVEVS